MDSAPPLATFPRLPNLRRVNGSETTCRACKHFFAEPPPGDNLKAPEAGACRRYPPTPITLMQMTPRGPQASIMSVAASVSPEFSCGEFAGKPTAE